MFAGERLHEHYVLGRQLQLQEWGETAVGVYRRPVHYNFIWNKNK